MSKGKYTYEYPRPALTVDAVVFGVDNRSIAGGTSFRPTLKVLLIKRAGEPFAGWWALPGGFVEMGESTDQAVRRELEEETGLKNIFLEQLYTFSDPERDPRERVVDVAHFALVSPARLKPTAGSDAAATQWFPVGLVLMKNVDLAFDHSKILQVAVERLRAKLRYQPIGFELLPKKFTLSDLQGLYEAILGRTLDKRNFRRKAMAQGIIKELPERGGKTRTAQLYRFDKKAYQSKLKSGFNFDL